MIYICSGEIRNAYRTSHTRKKWKREPHKKVSLREDKAWRRSDCGGDRREHAKVIDVEQLADEERARGRKGAVRGQVEFWEMSILG
jgi:hypothetical protein